MGKKDPRVDAYIGQSADFAKPILTHLREAVHESCPEVVETMKWSAPFFEYRGVLAGMAANNIHPESAARLHDLNLEARGVPDQERSRLIDLWSDFHDLILGIAGNSVLELFAKALGDLYKERIVHRDRIGVQMFTPEGRKKTQREHERIARSIAQGKAERAERLMRDHMRDFLTEVASRHQAFMNEIITWS